MKAKYAPEDKIRSPQSTGDDQRALNDPDVRFVVDLLDVEGVVLGDDCDGVVTVVEVMGVREGSGGGGGRFG